MTPRLAPLLAVTIGAMFITNPAFAYTQEGGAYRFPTGSNTLHRAKYGDDRVDVTNEAALRAAVADPYISEIWLRADITLTNSNPCRPCATCATSPSTGDATTDGTRTSRETEPSGTRAPRSASSTRITNPASSKCTARPG